ncbi:MAG: hypothetical protein WBD40_19010 [Tepidisphaeraceae bacterium]
MLPDGVAVHLPDASIGPGYRDSLAGQSDFSVEDVGDRVVVVAPREGAGVVRDYLRLDFLCDRSTDLDDIGVFESVRNRPPQTNRRMDVQRLQRELQRLSASAGDNLAAELAAVNLATARAAQQGELAAYLRQQAAQTFEDIPSSSWWYLSMDPVMLRRAAFFRTQLGMTLAPDLLHDSRERTYLRGFGGLTMSNGVNFTELVAPALLAFSPVSTGILLTALPHAVVLMTGTPMELRVPWPATPQQLFEPRMLSDQGPRASTSFYERLTATEAHELLEWWVGRLNVVFSHALDPTRWVHGVDASGVGSAFLDVESQTAWLVSLERLVADGTFLLGQPSAPDLARVQVAFDLLDKAEALIGYGRDRSGKGFEALLKRRYVVRRLNAAWETMPPSLARRFRDHTKALFDTLYSRVRENSAPPRLTKNGIKLARRNDPSRLDSWSMDDYVAALSRAVRNSSHGLLEMLREGDDRYLLATNTGDIPQELTEVAALVMFGLIADAEKLCDGTWAKTLLV